MTSDTFFDASYFFVLCKRHPNTLPHFKGRSDPTIPPATFEVMGGALQEILLSTSKLAELTSWPDASPA